MITVPLSNDNGSVKCGKGSANYGKGSYRLGMGMQ